jgi:hypothetical protein
MSASSSFLQLPVHIFAFGDADTDTDGDGDGDGSFAADVVTLETFLSGTRAALDNPSETHVVIDLWTTKCTRCPSLLDKLNREAEMSTKGAMPPIKYVSLCLSQGGGNIDMASVLLGESGWSNLTHLFMDEASKECAKTALGFTSVPFVVVIGPDGGILGCGDPKAFDYKAVIAAANAENQAQTPMSSTAALVFDEDF